MRSGRYGAAGSLHDLPFCATPVLEIATSFPTALLVELVSTVADRVIDTGWKVGWLFADDTPGLTAGVVIYGGTPFHNLRFLFAAVFTDTHRSKMSQAGVSRS
jgi:hypothetical protein